MSEISQYEAGLLFRSSWLLEQLLKTDLEIFRYEKKEVPPEFSHVASLNAEDQSFEVSFSVKKLERAVST